MSPLAFPTWVEINDLHNLTCFRLFILIKVDICIDSATCVCGGEPTSRIAGLFLRILCWNALCSLMISIFKVHQAGLRGDKIDVVVKVQHPGIQDLMLNDIRNLQAFALYILKNDIKFYLISVTKEMEKQIGYEFDFLREVNAMERICDLLYENNLKNYDFLNNIK